MVEIRTHDLRKKKVTEEENTKVEEKPKEEIQVPIEPVLKPEPVAEEPVQVELPAVAVEAKQVDSTSSESSAKSIPQTRRRPTRRLPSRDKQDGRKDAGPAPSRRTTRSARPKRSAPVIGITASFEHLPDRNFHSQQYFYLYRPYITAIHEAGGVPVIIPVGLEKRYVNHMADLIDGLLLPGDPADVDPNRYGDLPRDKLGRVEPRKDRTEIELFNLAFGKNIPILGICRGIQIMNVALDGTLYQDISEQVRMGMNHNPKMPQVEVIHWVDLTEGTKLQKIFGERQIWVNSSHHQAVKLHGKGLNVNAKAPDGITEGIEHPAKSWVIGVQWHPELLWLRDKLQAKLFTEFVEACKI